ncbi:MAG TPA: NAD(P)H-binding protein [Gemmatimonadaceae bacterium]|nr:NAD(P)H-binding protein [Gemmatimonadaceae bacterium]
MLLVGATGLVGRECLRLLLADPEVIRLVVLTRRPLPLEVGAAKLDAHVVDFDHLDGHADLFAVDQIICALGTTMRQAGSRERFRAVDFGLALQVARLGASRGVRHFLLVSSLGANAGSLVFYNRVKGELEEALRGIPYRSLTVVRPSLLLGKRGERRVREQIGKRLARLAPRRYRPVEASVVAERLVHEARLDAPGVRVIESAELRRQRRAAL